MLYYSTNKQAQPVDLQEAAIKGLPADNGLFMPETIHRLPESFFERLPAMTFREMAGEVAQVLFGEDIEADTLQDIVDETLDFETPIVRIRDNSYALELFHGPTLAFKDVGARFMARLLAHFVRQQNLSRINVLVATSGDTGSAVANGFLGVAGIHVYVLYPKGKVSAIQECQFTTLQQNITALEIDGTFDDCQALVKAAFLDKELNERMKLTSANSINIARFLPQTFYYFNAYAQLLRLGVADGLVVCVPCGNLGNLAAGLIAREMGLPVKRFIAANNQNDVFLQYLLTGVYTPRPSVRTLANAMDVGNPSNFVRILDLYQHNHETITRLISGFSCSDDRVRETVAACCLETGYLLDPHGACAFKALSESLQPGETGVFLETAHPAKFRETIESITGVPVQIPPGLLKFTQGTKKTVEPGSTFGDFKAFLLRQN